MTPEEAIHFANALDRPDVFSMRDAAEDMLSALEAAADGRTLRKARKTLLERAEHFRRADTPGHANWYPPALRAAALACSRWADKCQGIVK